MGAPEIHQSPPLARDDSETISSRGMLFFFSLSSSTTRPPVAAIGGIRSLSRDCSGALRRTPFDMVGLPGSLVDWDGGGGGGGGGGGMDVAIHACIVSFD
mmetsp:Transcript_26768/g.53836  ORF Transcript_26768/g.53836 Transcript_26768/m.53836 type:complete len:100 (+) Transcript_26768:360-659(+)